MINANALQRCSLILLLLTWIQGCEITALVDAADRLGGSTKPSVVGEPISKNDISQAFKEALRIGSENVSLRLGVNDAFNGDPEIRIPLPPDLERLGSVMHKAGLGAMVDDFEVKLNRAAERAAPLVKDVFLKAITEMTFSDIRRIYNGPDDAATLYFQQKTSTALKNTIKPIVDDSLSKVGAIQSYDRVISKYGALPFVPHVKADISGHVVDRTLTGVFHYLAVEEAAIRRNPARRTTELLKRVFGA